MKLRLGWECRGRQDARSSFALGIWKSHKQIAGCADRSHPDQGREARPKLARFFFGGVCLIIMLGWDCYGVSQMADEVRE